MKQRKTILASTLLLLALTSCSTESVKFENNLDKYIKEMNWQEDFSILQLSDIHWSIGTQIGSSQSYVQKIIDEANAHVKKTSNGAKQKVDLIQINGDAFMLNNKDTVINFLSFMESQEIPYSTSWGNHDKEASYSANWLSEQFKNAKNSLYTELDNDDVHERSNYVINLKDGETTKWQIAILDSGAYHPYSAFSPTETYDYLRDDQAKWWKAEHDLVGENVPAVAYFHIPAERSVELYEASQEEGSTIKNKFFKEENFGNSKLDIAKSEGNEFIEVGKQNNLKAVFNGHCHNNDWTADDDGLTIGLGVKSSLELYYAHLSEEEVKKANLVNEDDGKLLDTAFDLVGGSLLTLKSDQSFDLEHLYLNEKSDGSIWKAWVRY